MCVCMCVFVRVLVKFVFICVRGLLADCETPVKEAVIDIQSVV